MLSGVKSKSKTRKLCWRLQMYERIRAELEGGGRAYIICPLVEASKAATLEDVKAAEDEHARLVAGADWIMRMICRHLRRHISRSDMQICPAMHMAW
jgi:RecG-like helicase